MKDVDETAPITNAGFLVQRGLHEDIRMKLSLHKNISAAFLNRDSRGFCSSFFPFRFNDLKRVDVPVECRRFFQDGITIAN